MIRRRCSRRGDGGGARGAPSPDESRLARQAPGGVVARIGAPPLIALATALGMLALLLCAFFVPGFVLRADAGAARLLAQPAATQPAGEGTGEEAPGAGDAVPADPVAVRPAADETPVSSAPAQLALAEAANGQVLATLSWGDGSGEVGLVQPAEGLTRGPEALAVAPDGRIAILDSVNSRLVLLAGDGSSTGTVPLQLTMPRFLAVDNELLYVLDADVDRQLVCLDWQGTEMHRAQIPALDDVVTSLFDTDSGPCVEVAHDDVFLVEFKDDSSQDATQQAAVQTAPGQQAAGQQAAAPKRAVAAALHALAGRPVDRDLKKATKATFKPNQGLKLDRFKIDKKTLKAVQTQAATPALPPGKKVEHLVSVDGDGRGGLIIGARLLREPGDGDDAPSLVIGRVPDSSGSPGAASVMSDTLTLRDSTFAYLGQPYVVAPDGRIFQPVGTESGYTLLVYSLPAATGAGEVQP